jgi:hypothetical protein
MANQRNRLISLINYIESCGITINLAKNKARGHRGYFKTDGKNFRIDLSKELKDDDILKTLAHEFAHFVHYNYDNTLKSLDFIFEDENKFIDELIDITVLTIPKCSVEPIFKIKSNLEKDILDLQKQLDKFSIDTKQLEKNIKNTKLKYLLKYDKVKLLDGFKTTQLSIDLLGYSTDIEIYLHLSSKKRALKKIHSKITRLNKYYNSPTELFARSFELYISNPEILKTKAPNVYNFYKNIKENNKIPLICEFINKAKEIKS